MVLLRLRISSAPYVTCKGTTSLVPLCLPLFASQAPATSRGRGAFISSSYLLVDQLYSVQPGFVLSSLSSLMWSCLRRESREPKGQTQGRDLILTSLYDRALSKTGWAKALDFCPVRPCFISILCSLNINQEDETGHSQGEHLTIQVSGMRKKPVIEIPLFGVPSQHIAL